MKKIKQLIESKKSGLIVMVIVVAIGTACIVGVLYFKDQQAKAHQAEMQRQVDVLQTVEVTQLITELEYGHDYTLSDLLSISDVEGVNVVVVNNDMAFEAESTATYMQLGEQVLKATLTYEDSSEEREFKYEVKDTQSPVLEGIQDYTITMGDELDYKSSLKAKDLVDGELDVEVIGDVDTGKAGEYEVTVNATDLNGNTTTETIKITVKEKEVVATTPKPSKPSGTTSSGSNSNATTGTSNTTTGGNVADKETPTTCTPRIGNSGKLFNTEEEAISWADDYMMNNVTEISSYLWYSTCGQFSIEWEYR